MTTAAIVLVLSGHPIHVLLAAVALYHGGGELLGLVRRELDARKPRARAVARRLHLLAR